MNQIAKMFMESNDRMKKIMKGNFRLDEIASAQREFEGQIKLINAVVSAYGIASKNKRALTGMERMNLLDGTTAIDMKLGDPEVDMVKCPLKDNLITRAECLSYSGHHTVEGDFECAGCEIGVETKDKLLPAQA